MINRRFFLKTGALALVGISSGIAVPSFLQRTVLAAGNSSRKKTLIVIFQRGAADGLNIVVPFGDTNYYKARPNIAIAQPKAGDEQTAIDLDGFFGLHPAMKSFKPLYDNHQLAIMHAAGSPDSTRSHFDAQDYMESGTPGIKSTSDGWLNRYLQSAKIDNATPLRGIAMGNKQPRAMAGVSSTVTIGNIGGFDVRGGNQVSNAFEAMYGESDDKILQPAGTEAFEAIKMIRRIRAAGYTPANSATYPQGPFGNSLKQIAQLIKADAGVEIAFAESNGWDTHTGEKPRLNALLTEFSRGIAALTQDLGDRMEDVVIVTMSEFGRTVKENGTAGTDHGHATCMFVIGGKVKGGKIYGKWPGLDHDQLHEGRDLALVNDFRGVCAETIASHFGIKNINTIFPNFNNKASLAFI